MDRRDQNGGRVSAGRRIKAANQAITEALHAMQKSLEYFARERLVAIQKRNPRSDVSFACAMGTWSFYRERKDDETRRCLDETLYDDPKLDRQFQAVLSEFGWGAIPVVALSFDETGQIVRRTEW